MSRKVGSPVSMDLEPGSHNLVDKKELEADDNGNDFFDYEDDSLANSLLWPEVVIVECDEDDADVGDGDDPLRVDHFCQVTMEESTDDIINMADVDCTEFNDESLNTLSNRPSTKEYYKYTTGKKQRNPQKWWKVHKCIMCDYNTPNRLDFKQHQKIHVREKCEICDYVYSKPDEIETHTCEKPFTCDICNFKSVQPQSLKRHIKIHSDHKPHFCSYCNLRFYRSCHLKQHMRIHTGERPYVCYICDYRFTQTSTLNRHMKTHTGEKPYGCETCGRMFRQKCQLKKHMNTHLEHACPFCGLKFNHPFLLTCHLRNAHLDETSNS